MDIQTIVIVVLAIALVAVVAWVPGTTGVGPRG